MASVDRSTIFHTQAAPAERRIHIQYVPGSAYPFQIEDSMREPDGSWRPVVLFCYQDPQVWASDAYGYVRSYRQAGVPLSHNLAIEPETGGAA